MGIVARTRAWSLRRRLALLALGGLVLVGGLGWWLLSTYNEAVNASRQATAVLGPLSDGVRAARLAYTDADGWVAAAVIQGLRGSRLTPDSPAVVGYRGSSAALRTALDGLRTRSGDVPDLAGVVGDFDSAARRWLRVDAEPAVALVLSGRPEEAARLTTSAPADEAYSDMTSAADRLTRGIESEQTASVAAVRDFGVQLGLALLVALVLLLVFVLVALLLLRRWVLRPLEDLGAQMRAVAQERDHTRQIRPVGPPEIVALSKSADLMRDQLLTQRDLTADARRALRSEDLTKAELQDALESSPSPTPGLRVAGGVLRKADDGIAGDVVDTWTLADGRVALILADVSGHGQAAALVGLRLKVAALRSLLAGHALADVMTDLAAVFATQESRFATCVVVVISPQDGQLRWANAGHLPPMLLHDDDGDGTPAPGESVQRLDTTGPILSVLGGTWDERTTRLGPDDVLLLWTDGLVEGRDESGDEIGEEGLRRIIDSARSGRGATDVRAHPEELVRVVRGAIRRRLGEDGWQRDDVSLLAVTRDQVGVPAARRPPA